MIARFLLAICLIAGIRASMTEQPYRMFDIAPEPVFVITIYRS